MMNSSLSDVRPHRKHSSLSHLRQGYKEVDTRVEFDFAKLTTQRRLPAYGYPAAHGIFITLPRALCIFTMLMVLRLSGLLQRSVGHDDAKRRDPSDQKSP
ncbi:hypothetical protein Plhal710r2_c028g0105131 [Plasmopara halstedii]